MHTHVQEEGVRLGDFILWGKKKKRAAETALTVVVGEDAEAGIWLESTPIQQWESSVYLS